jgi:hypothetical protein
MESWYTMPLARVAAGVIVLVVAVNVLAYRQAHRPADPVVSARPHPTPGGTAFAVHRQRTAIAQARADQATALAVQTEAAVAVATLGARVTSIAAAAHPAQTVQARLRAAAAARAQGTLVGQSGGTAAASTRWQTGGPFAGSYQLLDTVDGLRATVGAPQLGISSLSGEAPGGSINLWFAAAEHNSGKFTFLSSPSHFSLVSSTGTLYRYTALDPPPGSSDHRVFRTALLGPGAGNGGYLRFLVPNSPYTYTLLWQEQGMLPQPVCQVQVGFGGRVALTP